MISELLKDVERYKKDIVSNSDNKRTGYYLGMIRAIKDILKIIKQYGKK